MAAGYEVGEARESLSAAETAFEQVDYLATYQTCSKALERGHANPRQTLRLHVLCGISAAALDKADESRSHFKVALALQSELRMDRELSPKIRSPYLEAQGYWSRFDERLSVKSFGRDSSSQLTLTLGDPAQLASKVRISSRVLGRTQFQSFDLEPGPRLKFQLAQEQSAQGFEYYVAVLDAHENVLLEHGNEAEPIEVLPLSRGRSKNWERTQQKTKTTLVEPVTGRSPWLPMALMGAGLASAGVGVYFNVLRENAAHKWNGEGCEQPGLARIEQCSAVNSNRVHAERATIGFYAAGGVLLTTGITVLAIQGSVKTDSQASGAASTSFACSAALPFAALACRGQF